MLLLLAALICRSVAQTECGEGNGALDMTPPKDMSVEDVIQKLVAAETKVKEARSHYTYTQDLMVQTLSDNKVDGQYHQVAAISYDDKGNRVEKVTFAEQSTLRGVELSAADRDDVRVFMQWILSSDELPAYNVTYAGQQHVDDLDTFVFHIVPKREEKNTRYFQGKVWVDNHDLEIVKLCGKSVPDMVAKKKKDAQEIRPTFVGYRQLVDGFWFPAYVRVDDTLHFRVEAVHVREIVKFTGYRRANPTTAKQ